MLKILSLFVLHLTQSMRVASGHKGEACLLILNHARLVHGSSRGMILIASDLEIIAAVILVVPGLHLAVHAWLEQLAAT
jgi:hypothetical protein